MLDVSKIKQRTFCVYVYKAISVARSNEWVPKQIGARPAGTHQSRRWKGRVFELSQSDGRTIWRGAVWQQGHKKRPVIASKNVVLSWERKRVERDEIVSGGGCACAAESKVASWQPPSRSHRRLPVPVLVLASNQLHGAPTASGPERRKVSFPAPQPSAARTPCRQWNFAPSDAEISVHQQQRSSFRCVFLQQHARVAAFMFTLAAREVNKLSLCADWWTPRVCFVSYIACFFVREEERIVLCRLRARPPFSQIYCLSVLICGRAKLPRLSVWFPPVCGRSVPIVMHLERDTQNRLKSLGETGEEFPRKCAGKSFSRQKSVCRKLCWRLHNGPIQGIFVHG